MFSVCLYEWTQCVLRYTDLREWSRWSKLLERWIYGKRVFAWFFRRTCIVSFESLSNCRLFSFFPPSPWLNRVKWAAGCLRCMDRESGTHWQGWEALLLLAVTSQRDRNMDAVVKKSLASCMSGLKDGVGKKGKDVRRKSAPCCYSPVTYESSWIRAYQAELHRERQVSVEKSWRRISESKYASTDPHLHLLHDIDNDTLIWFIC